MVAENLNRDGGERTCVDSVWRHGIINCQVRQRLNGSGNGLSHTATTSWDEHDDGRIDYLFGFASLYRPHFVLSGVLGCVCGRVGCGGGRTNSAL